MSRPQLWVLAGGNGAGKSTFYVQFLKSRNMLFVNADHIARQLNPDDTVSTSYAAARLAHNIRKQLIEERTSFCFETVFSHPSKIDFLATAKAAGYEIILVFIHLDHIALNKARVLQRVSEGGHDVPKQKISSRVPRSLRNIKTAIPLCDRVELFDNSSYTAPLVRAASIQAGTQTALLEPMPAWARELLNY